MYWMRKKENNFPIRTLICRPAFLHFIRKIHVSLIISLVEATLHMLITFAKNLDTDQDQHTVGPDLDSKTI